MSQESNEYKVLSDIQIARQVKIQHKTNIPSLVVQTLLENRSAELMFSTNPIASSKIIVFSLSNYANKVHPLVY